MHRVHDLADEAATSTPPGTAGDPVAAEYDRALEILVDNLTGMCDDRQADRDAQAAAAAADAAALQAASTPELTGARPNALTATTGAPDGPDGTDSAEQDAELLAVRLEEITHQAINSRRAIDGHGSLPLSPERNGTDGEDGTDDTGDTGGDSVSTPPEPQ